jgi:hypothetical protein
MRCGVGEGGGARVQIDAHRAEPVDKSTPGADILTYVSRSQRTVPATHGAEYPALDTRKTIRNRRVRCKECTRRLREMYSRRYGRKVTTYPLFDQVANVATDERWRAYFKECAKGMLPRGVVLNGRVISYVHGTEAHYELSVEPERAYRELCAFFARHPKTAPVESVPDERTADRKVQAEETVQAEESAEVEHKGRKPKKGSKVPKRGDGWLSIKSRNRRLALLSHFVETVVAENELTAKQKSDLQYEISRADLDNALDRCVRFVDGRIEAITCIVSDGGSFRYEPDADVTRPVIRAPPPPNPIYRNYPARQLDPDAVISAHLIALRKSRASTTVKKASTLA